MKTKIQADEYYKKVRVHFYDFEGNEIDSKEVRVHGEEELEEWADKIIFNSDCFSTWKCFDF